MIIGQFGEAFPPLIDGVAQVIKNYAYWMSRKNNECHVITIKYPNAEDDYNFKVHRYNSFRVPFKKDYRTGIPKLDRRFYNNIQSIDFDIIHSHSPFSAGKLGLDIAGQLDIPSVMTFHTKFRDIFKQIVKTDFMADMMINQIMKYFDMADDVWIVNKSAEETLREYGYKGDVFTAENACDFMPERKSNEALHMINKMYHIPEDVSVFSFIGRMNHHKNIKLILDALKILDRKGYDFRMFLVGYGEKKHEFEKIAKSYGIDKKLIFTGNIYDRNILKNIYLRSLAVLFPSLFDVSSLVIKEASALKCPVVLIENSTTAQGVKDSYNGFLIENNANSLAMKTQMILNNPEIAYKAGEYAYKTLYRSWEQSVDKVINRYHYLINKKRHLRLNA